MKSSTYGFGFDPVQSKNHFFVLISPKERNANSPPLVKVYERFSWTIDGEQVIDDNVDKLRIEISPQKWHKVKAELTAEFNFSLKKDGLKIGKFLAVGGTPVERLFGKEMMILLWAIENCDMSVISTAVRNWKGLMPEERWWLYTMTNATMSDQKTISGWRKALQYALCENPIEEKKSGRN